MKLTRISAVLLVLTLVVAVILSPVLTGTIKAVDDCVAATVYVDASRPNDSGDGLSWTHAKKTIQAGINAVCHGGTVYVAEGVYNQPADSDGWDIVHLDEDLTLIGAGAPKTIIDGQNLYRGISITSHDGQVNTIRGFTVRNCRGPNYEDALLPTFSSYLAGVGISFPDVRPGMFNGSRTHPDGGGIWITDWHTVTIEDCSIIDNHGRDGGGIYNSGQLTMNRCTVANNAAYGQGGGIYMYFPGGEGHPAATLDLTNCTISGNTAIDGDGGGIYCGTEMHLLNCTITGNSATDETAKGGGFANYAQQTAYFNNCIVANNTATDASTNNGYSSGVVVSGGYNIDSENSCYFDEPTDQINTDPLLGPLQNNGGPTSTCAITAGSPAYNRGTGGTDTDQRGITRPQAGAYDIGAYELIATPTIIACSPDQSLAGLCPLTVVITGTNLDWVTSVNFGPGITVNSFQANSPTQITANICIAGAAAPGPRDISVTTPWNTITKANAFTVIPLSALNSGGSGSSGTGGGGTPGNTPPVPLASIVVQSASLSTKAVTPGTPVTVTADITNKSTVNGAKKVTLYVNGQVESTQGVTVNSGSSSKLTFNVSRSEPGDYTVYVDGVPAGSFKVEMITGNDSILIFSAVLIALVFILGLVMLWRRQRTG